MKISLVLAFGSFIVILFSSHIFSKRFRESWLDTKYVQLLWMIDIGFYLIFVSTDPLLMIWERGGKSLRLQRD